MNKMNLVSLLLIVGMVSCQSVKEGQTWISKETIKGYEVRMNVVKRLNRFGVVAEWDASRAIDTTLWHGKNYITIHGDRLIISTKYLRENYKLSKQ